MNIQSHSNFHHTACNDEEKTLTENACYQHEFTCACSGKAAQHSKTSEKYVILKNHANAPTLTAIPVMKAALNVDTKMEKLFLITKFSYPTYCFV